MATIIRTVAGAFFILFIIVWVAVVILMFTDDNGR